MQEKGVVLAKSARNINAVWWNEQKNGTSDLTQIT